MMHFQGPEPEAHPLKIARHELKNEVQVLLLWVDVNKLNHVRIVQLLQQLDLPQRRDVDALLVLAQPDLLDGHNSSGLGDATTSHWFRKCYPTR